MTVAVPMMHEQVHQRTGQDQQPRQRPKNVCGMFRKQEKAADHEKNQADDASRGAPKGFLLLRFASLKILPSIVCPGYIPTPIMPIGPIINSSAVFFWSALKEA